MKKIITICLLLSSLVSFSQSTTLVISQAYGSGGNAGAVYNADYVELKNISGAPISLAGYSIQYGSATVTGAWSGVYALPAATIPAGGYYLIQMSAAGTTGAALPTPDAVANPTINMSGSNGRVGLSSGTTALSGCPSSAAVIDKVGYGTSSCAEGTATAALSAPNAVIRKNNGCTDTDNNASDFDVTAAAPHNSASPVSSCGGAPSPALTANPVTITSFGSINVGSNSASAQFTVSGTNLTGAPGVITITAPSTNFQVSNNNSSWAASTTIPYSSATLAATVVYVRFTPQSAGALSGNVSITGGGAAAAVTVAVSGTGVAIVPTLGATTLTSFGNICANATAGPNSFNLNGANLTNANITVGPLAGYTFATTAGGTYSASLDLTQTGGIYSQDIFVKFKPTALQSYNGDIPVSGGGDASAITVAATGAGVNLPPVEATGVANSVTAFGASLTAAITDTGCTSVTAYGIEYSTVSGFANGSGTKVAATNLAAGIYSSAVAGLAPSTTYYYKAYATNGAGTSYDVQRSFTTLACVAPTVETDTVHITTSYYDAQAGGSVVDTGCSNVTAYGIEYSSIGGFANGQGTKVFSNNISANGFTAQVAGLIQNTTYYFKAFTTNNGGTTYAYGVQDTFTTKKLPSGLIVYSVPAVPGQLLHYSMDNAARGHYTVQLFNSAGQVVYKKEMMVQVGFIDDSFVLPALSRGVYTLSVLPDGKDNIYKKILVQ